MSTAIEEKGGASSSKQVGNEATQAGSADVKGTNDGVPANGSSPEAVDRELSTLRSCLISICLTLSLTIVLLDTTFNATAIYNIGSDLLCFLPGFVWILQANVLGTFFVLPFVPYYRSLLLRRFPSFQSAPMCLALLIYSSTTLGIGFTQQTASIMPLRVLQGLAGGTILLLTPPLFLELKVKQPFMSTGGVLATMTAATNAAGPLIGGAVTRYILWRWLFWGNGICGFILTIVLFFTWPTGEKRQNPGPSLRQLDIIGALFPSFGLFLFVFALQMSGFHKHDPWSSPIFLAPLILSTLCFAITGCWAYWLDQREFDAQYPRASNGDENGKSPCKRVKSALLRVKPALSVDLVFRNRRVFTGIACAMLTGFPQFFSVYNIPLRFQIVHLQSSFMAGVGLEPLLGAAAVGIIFSGTLNALNKKRIARKGEDHGWLNLNAYLLFFAGTILAAGSAFQSRVPNTIHITDRSRGYQVLFGAGVGMSIPAAIVGATDAVEKSDIPTTLSLLTQSRQMGGAIGLATGAAMLHQLVQEQLLSLRPDKKLPAPSDAQLLALHDSVERHLLSPGQRAAVRFVFADAFARPMRLCAAFGAGCALVGLGLLRRRKE